MDEETSLPSAPMLAWIRNDLVLITEMIAMNRENAFEAMCARASDENWCWKIFCGTCRHAYFRCGFLELADGKHPDDEAWLSGRRRHHEMFRQLFDRSERALEEPGVQRAIAGVLADASIKQIASVCRRPDWLGYIGLGLFHTEPVEQIDRKLTNMWIPQLVLMLREDASSRKILQSIFDQPAGVLRWQDLGKLEMELLGQ